MAKRAKPKRDNAKQSQKFIDAAKSLGLGGSNQAFESVMGKLVLRKPAAKKK